MLKNVRGISVRVLKIVQNVYKEAKICSSYFLVQSKEANLICVD